MLFRSIESNIKMNEQVNQGAKLGHIKFGSRVDIYVPDSTKMLVKKGNRVKGPETILAIWK